MPDRTYPGLTASDKAVIGFALVLPTLVTLAYFVLAAGLSPGVQQTVYAVAKVFQFLLPIGWVWLAQRNRPRWSGFTAAGIVQGALFGLAIAILTLALYFEVFRQMEFFVAGVEKIREKIQGMNLTNPLVFAAVGVFYSLVHSLLEEYYWRWFVFGQLRRAWSLAPAILVSSLGFMAHHVLVIGTYFGYTSFWTWFFSLSVAIGGAAWAWLYNRTGSLVGPWISHLLVDAAIFAIGYDLAKQLPAG